MTTPDALKPTPPTPWTHDLYVSMSLDYFEQRRPHPFRDKVRIGTPDNPIEYHRMTGDVYAKLMHRLNLLLDDDSVSVETKADALAKIAPIYDWVHARVSEDKLGMYEDKLAREVERREQAKRERDAALGDY